MGRILLADDHELLRDVLKAYLELDGSLEVVAASGVPEALALIEAQGAFDLVVLDLRMPGMDGLVGLERVLACNAGRPVAIMSGLAPPDAAARIGAMGAAGFLPKTLPAKNMIAAVRQMLAGSKFFPEDEPPAHRVPDNASQAFSPREQFQNALRSDEFYLAYEPIVDLHSKSWIGAEALMRWRVAGGEEISPAQFVPLAIREGYTSSLTRKLFQLLMRDCGEIFASAPSFTISLNIFGNEVTEPGFFDELLALASSTGGKPSNFTIEIIEYGMMDQASARTNIKKMRDLGFNVAIDDFGRGSSNLSYIVDYEFSTLKIDRSFISNVPSSDFESKMLEHIVWMARDFNFNIICEGVEQEKQAAYIKSLGVKYAQGWLYSKAISYQSLLDKLSENTLTRINNPSVPQ